MKNTKWTLLVYPRYRHRHISTNTNCSYEYNKRTITLFSRVATLCCCLAADYLFVPDYSPVRPHPQPRQPRRSSLRLATILVHDSHVVYDCLSSMRSDPSSFGVRYDDFASSVSSSNEGGGSCAFGSPRCIIGCITSSPAGRGTGSCYSYCYRTKRFVIPLARGSLSCLCDCVRCLWTCWKLADRPVRAIRAANCCR